MTSEIITEPSTEINEEALQKTFNKTFIFDKAPRNIQGIFQHIKENYSQHTMTEWVEVYNNFIQKMRDENIGYTSFPEDEREKFYTSAKINAINGEIMKALFEAIDPRSNLPKLEEIYNNCVSADFLEVKEEIEKLLPSLLKIMRKKGYDSKELRKAFFDNEKISQYFSSFTFDMKNKHSGKHESTLDKNIKFATEYNGDLPQSGCIFRFTDSLEEALKKAIVEGGVIKNKDEVIKNILLPKIWNGCHVCDDDNHITFNHDEKLLQEVFNQICESALKKRNTNLLKAKVATKGKMIFINDVRNIAPKNRTLSDEVRDFGNKKDISTYINVWEGQNGYMNIYAQLFNVAYIQAGNHGAHLKKTDKGLKVTYSDSAGDGLGSISLSLWAASLIDYDSAIKLAGSEGALLEKLKYIDHTIVDVKPGTYEVTNYVGRSEESSWNSKSDVAFGQLVWKSDATELKPLTEKQWEKLK